MAIAAWIVPITAGTRIKSRDENEVGGEGRGIESSGNGHGSILERLAEDF